MEALATGFGVRAPRRTRGDCTVRALASVAGISYDLAETIATAAGRKAGCGFKSAKLIEAAKKSGLTFRKVRMAQRTLAKFLREHPTGTFYVRKAGHAFGVKDGVVSDSTKPTALVRDAWQFIPAGVKVAEPVAAPTAPVVEATTREQWLTKAATLLAPHFKSRGFTLPANVRMTCGFPSKKAFGRKQRIGECWSAEASGDKHFEVFISPVLDGPMAVLETLVHELCHATVGLAEGHKGKFAACARQMGLEGKLTATTAGERFKTEIGTPVLKALGKYPHAKLTGTVKEKKQTTRLIKCVCEDCGYTIRTTRGWLDMGGAPICPLDNQQMVEA